MANLIRLQQRVKVEAQGLFASHSGDIYVFVVSSEDKAFTFWEVFAAAPTEADFNDLPKASRLTNTADGVIKVKTGATTWADITMS